ncbi:MAG: tetratricopeptide repeat protein [Sphingomicrobium sp.]
MKHLFAIAGAALLATSASPAAAAIYTLGGPLAEGCYQAAESRTGDRLAVEGCTRALSEEGLSAEDRAATYVNRGIVHMVRGRAAYAEADFDSALAIDADLADAYLNKGFLRIRSGQGRDALPLIQKGLDLGAEEKAVAWFGRGVAYEQMGDYAKAYRDFQRAQVLAPDWDMPSDYLANYRVGER